MPIIVEYPFEEFKDMYYPLSEAYILFSSSNSTKRVLLFVSFKIKSCSTADNNKELNRTIKNLIKIYLNVYFIKPWVKYINNLYLTKFYNCFSL